MSSNLGYENVFIFGQQNKVKRPSNNEEQPQAKRPRTELKTQQHNSTTINDSQGTEKVRPQPKHKLQPHPRYLTLYLKSPNNTPITLSDSAIRIELTKHKSGSTSTASTAINTPTKATNNNINPRTQHKNKQIKKTTKRETSSFGNGTVEA
ncbi:hypothetical protein CHS0354_001058 [Potamilus streckersoni]|uniref:Uncharacterized protein n=1 Tax=Potamilus streckersoni TaxID=2493646 RepID=A0AAE0SU11_9BIVA|nr:hypothetical protein CHS0354_001058 [Potamilus streckersoni]